jgi:hypothetical protein
LYGMVCWWSTKLAWEVLVGQRQWQGLVWLGDWNIGDFQYLDEFVWGYHWLESFWQWSIWIKFHMIEEVLEIWRRRILPYCHVNNQLGRGSNRAKLGQGCKQWWCFPCFTMLWFPWNACLGQWL